MGPGGDHLFVKFLTAALFTVAVLPAAAQQISSFTPSDFTGLVTTKLSPTRFRVDLLPGASYTNVNGTFPIGEVFAFYTMTTSGSITSSASASAPTGWTYSSTTSVAGWEDNKKKASIKPGQYGVFEYSALTTTTGATAINGYHIRIGGTQVTQFLRIRSQAVPEPASMAVLGIGLAAIRRRRKG